MLSAAMSGAEAYGQTGAAMENGASVC